MSKKFKLPKYNIYEWKDPQKGFTIEVDNDYLYGNSTIFFSRKNGIMLNSREWFFEKYPWAKQIYCKKVIKAL